MLMLSHAVRTVRTHVGKCMVTFCVVVTAMIYLVQIIALIFGEMEPEILFFASLLRNTRIGNCKEPDTPTFHFLHVAA
jgi:hypothetical protein